MNEDVAWMKDRNYVIEKQTMREPNRMRQKDAGDRKGKESGGWQNNVREYNEPDRRP